NQKLLRHAGADRLFHWLMAATMVVLLATSLLPVLGLRFAWYGIHWVAGLVLTLLILLHIVRALFWQRPGTMLIRAADFSRRGAGKYTLAQKLMHLAWTVALLVAIVTGLLMLSKAGVPFLQRDPYVHSLAGWGALTLLHDLAALLSVFLILVHVYFGILPEKRAYLRAMLTGWITRTELKPEHDLQRVERGD
ncbi:MAG TPA: cytochrome b/b6 domain-containing protein, partial [Steroidobacteraceae bacterium]|nr:cytochrome b/b6 domain-containing protein [Steroidobacteraceae bacterium]